MNTDKKAFRRIVTSHDADGKAIISSDAPPVRTYMVGGPKGATFYEVWSTLQTPALIGNEPGEPEEAGLILPPPKGGTRIRVIDFPAESEAIRNLTKEEAHKHFRSMGDEQAPMQAKALPSVDAPHGNDRLWNCAGR